jgi:hypothetical protein
MCLQAGFVLILSNLHTAARRYRANNSAPNAVAATPTSPSLAPLHFAMVEKSYQNWLRTTTNLPVVKNLAISNSYACHPPG